MCGIAGLFCRTQGGTIAPETLVNMLSLSRYRGPDECGIYFDDWVGLGHNRLSIIDLAGGTQPIHNEDESLWIIYNGEVFNYPELKKDLLAKGHRFYTATDTEVILHLFEEKGSDCLNELNGQFAFAIWDSQSKFLFLARDRLGIRPLFYALHDDTLVFASEIKSLFAVPSLHRELEPTALHQVFTYWTTLPGQTVFKDIHELPPGHYLKASFDYLAIKKYWSIPFYPPEAQCHDEVGPLREQVLALLSDAIRIRLRSDVPVGCYLSGGLDSSGVTTLTTRNFAPVRTFGIRFEEKAFDEGEYQQQMVAFLNTQHTEIQATNAKIADSLPEVIWHCEKPILRTAPVPLFLLSQAVHDQGFKVVLTGEGADEIFGGYNIFRETKARAFWARQPESKIRSQLIGRLYPYLFNDPKLKYMLQSFFASGMEQVDDPFYSHRIRWRNTSTGKKFFSPELMSQANPDAEQAQLQALLPDNFSSLDLVARAQYLEMAIFLSNYLLSSQGDRVAMAHSVEIRLPYLDYRLVDFLGRVPAKWKLRALNEKYLLKKVFAGLLPEAIVRRPKNPYRAPIRESLGQYLSSTVISDVISETAIQKAGLFHPIKVRQLLRKIRSTEHSNEVDNMALMGIVTTHLVLEQFIHDFSHRMVTPVQPQLVYDRRLFANRMKIWASRQTDMVSY